PAGGREGQREGRTAREGRGARVPEPRGVADGPLNASSYEEDRFQSSSGRCTGRIPDNLGVRGQGVKVGERLLARLHPAERLGLPHPRERAADRGAGGETQPAHDILAPEERRCRLDRLLLLPAAEEVAEQRRPPPNAER